MRFIFPPFLPRLRKKLSQHEKTLKEFRCLLCKDTLKDPLSTPCGRCAWQLQLVYITALAQPLCRVHQPGAVCCYYQLLYMLCKGTLKHPLPTPCGRYCAVTAGGQAGRRGGGREGGGLRMHC